MRTVDHALEPARFGSHTITASVRGKAGQPKQSGQDELAKQQDCVSAVLGAGKAVVKAPEIL